MDTGPLPPAPRISGRTELIVHLGHPTQGFRSPLIYNPWFAARGIDVVVVPMACRGEDLAALLPALMRLDNVRGALITMPLKVAVVALLDEASAAVQVAGACNAVRRGPDGRLQGEQFDGEGFVRGLRRRGLDQAGARALVVGCGGVGSAIAAALAGAGLGELQLFDEQAARAAALAARLRRHFGTVTTTLPDAPDPQGLDLVVNATPLGSRAGDALPFAVDRLSPATFVGEVVLQPAVTPLLAAARARGCRTLAGEDMLFEQIPAYLAYFGLPPATPDELRRHALPAT
ncbi:MAG: ThiF family adenylyltransferase [Rubrivivax sp.]|nr:ThiF family adenylyltransferase [Rubrivivax sp.]